MWKKTDLRQVLKWSLGFFKEDSDKPSQKRLISFMLTLVLCYHSICHRENSELLVELFMFIAALLGMSYIPTRRMDNKT